MTHTDKSAERNSIYMCNQIADMWSYWWVFIFLTDNIQCVTYMIFNTIFNIFILVHFTCILGYKYLKRYLHKCVSNSAIDWQLLVRSNPPRKVNEFIGNARARSQHWKQISGNVNSSICRSEKRRASVLDELDYSAGNIRNLCSVKCSALVSRAVSPIVLRDKYRGCQGIGNSGDLRSRFAPSSEWILFHTLALLCYCSAILPHPFSPSLPSNLSSITLVHFFRSLPLLTSFVIVIGEYRQREIDLSASGSRSMLEICLSVVSLIFDDVSCVEFDRFLKVRRA